MNQPIAKSSLSLAQRRLVELLQEVPFCRLEDLQIVGGEPSFDPPPRVIRTLKMGGHNGPRDEAGLEDFWLKQPVVDLLVTIREIGDGEILTITVMHGLPHVVRSAIMCTRNNSFRLQDLFLEAYPLARRAAEVRSAYLIRVIRDPTVDREDLIQEALAGIWAALPRLDPARASLRTFVEKVVGARIASIYRSTRARKRTRETTDRDVPEPGRLLVTVELCVDLQRLLGRLGLREQKVAQLLGEHNPSQIALRLKISRQSVYRSIGRIRAALLEAEIEG